MNEAQGFYKCPECGVVETERRTSCPCGYKAPAPSPKLPAPGNESVPRQLAHYSSLLAFGTLFAVFLGSCLIEQPDSGRGGVAAAVLALIGVLLLASIGCAFGALCCIPWHGTKGILLKSIAGLGLSAAIIAWFVWAFHNVH